MSADVHAATTEMDKLMGRCSIRYAKTIGDFSDSVIEYQQAKKQFFYYRK